jgi:hypothetical protein
MIIWDTGEYEVLPYYVDKSLPETDDSRSEESDDAKSSQDFASDSAKLQEAFKNVCISFFLLGHNWLIINIAQNPASTPWNPLAEGLHNHVANG